MHLRTAAQAAALDNLSRKGKCVPPKINVWTEARIDSIHLSISNFFNHFFSITVHDFGQPASGLDISYLKSAVRGAMAVKRHCGDLFALNQADNYFPGSFTCV